MQVTFAAPQQHPPPAQVERRVEALLAQLTLDEKLRMLSGDETGFASAGVPRLGIPALKMTDGPVGVRDGSTAANAYPVSVNLAATFDTDLAARFGVALGKDTQAKGKHVLLGPCVGIARFPLGGRNFECFGEDAFLSSRMAVSVIQGIQSRPVIATVKHFAVNDQEWRRNTYDVIVDDRALHETHLLPFEAAVKEGKALGLMTAYNVINGQQASENKLLLDILKKDWRFPGVVISDWTSVYSADTSANSGLDIEMPAPLWWGDRLRQAIADGKVSMAVIDDKIRRHLRVRLLAGVFDNPEPKLDESVVRSQAHRDVALEIALKSMVLLKNDGILPLKRDKLASVALIGPNAAVMRAGGGGSSGVPPWVSVSPLEGFKAAVGPRVTVTTAQGVSLDYLKAKPLSASFLRTPDGKTEGLLGEYFNNETWQGKPALVRVDEGVNFDWKGGSPAPAINADSFSVRWTGTFMPNETRVYRFLLSSDDASSLYIDGKLITSQNKQQQPGEMLMQAGKSYAVRLEYVEELGDAAMSLGAVNAGDNAKPPSIEEAVALAKQAEVVVLHVGNSSKQELEGEDLPGFELVNGQEQLVSAVLEANPNTIVVLYGGVPFYLKNWLPRARAVVAAMYPGQEGGAALASLLLGDRSFSGKLPISYIQSRDESPAFTGYMDPSRKVHYSEGVFVGYKYLDQHKVEPLFPFGHGLSYTTFKYSGM
ncbi:MAG: glycoside hydrolase family 3 C-terminal domain-containing protein, partial [Chitinophagaceae bacterium]|nr:glycoside hydrolase family 3 C-terminal domain-containing protein [Rubrivivax sp.]